MTEHRENLFLCGLNHKSADVDLRSRFSLDAVKRLDMRTRLKDANGVAGPVIVSTCNRTEIYGVFPGPADEMSRRGLAETIFPGLEAAGASAYFRWGKTAAFHLFRVASGLDSLIIGESEILGQVKTAFEESQKEAQLHRAINDLFRQALMVGKRVRSETQLGEGSISLAATAVKLVKKIVGRLETKSALIVGAGETGIITARHLAGGGVEKLRIVNRTVSRAVELAAELKGEGAGLDRLAEWIGISDIVVACVEVPEPVITPRTFAGLNAKTRCLVDISIPRAIDPKVADETGVFLLDIDDLQKLVDDSQKERAERAGRAHEIIVEEVHKFLSLQSFAGMTPLVNEIRGRFDAALEEALKDAKKAGDIEATLKKFSAKLFAAALEGLKTSSRRHHSPDDLKSAYQAYLNEDV